MPAIDPVSDARVSEYALAQRGSDYQEYLAAIDPRFAAGRACRMAAAEGALRFARATHKELSALTQLQFLPWDTECLGFGVCRISHVLGSDMAAKTAVIQEALAEARRRGQRLVTTRVAGDDFTTLHALQSAGFRTVDAMNVFLWDARRGLPEIDHGGIEVLPLPPKGCNMDALRELAPGAFACSRLNNDPGFSREQVRKFYGRLFDSLMGHPAAVKLAARVADPGKGTSRAQSAEFLTGLERANARAPGESVEHSQRRGGESATLSNPSDSCNSLRDVAGFVVGKIDETASQDLTEPLGCLELIAVHPDLVGGGVGRALVKSFLRELGQRLRYIEVATQTHNYPALNLYAGLGLKLVSSLTTLHAWLNSQ